MSDQRNPSTAPANGAAPESPARPRLRSDYKVAAAIIVFALVVYAITTTFDEVPKALTQGVPPESYPRLLVWVLIGLSIALIFEARKRQEPPRKGPPAMVFKTAAVLIAATVSIEWLGIIGAMFLVCAVIPVMWRDRRHAITAVFAIIFPLAVYGLFHGLLAVQFPLGIFASMF